jgi:hypothetical protein
MTAPLASKVQDPVEISPGTKITLRISPLASPSCRFWMLSRLETTTFGSQTIRCGPGLRRKTRRVDRATRSPDSSMMCWSGRLTLGDLSMTSAHTGASGCAGRALFAALTEPRRSRNRDAGSRPFGDDPSRKSFGTPRRGQSVPRAAFGVAMLTLLRRPC